MKEEHDSAEERRGLSFFFPFDMGNPKSPEDTAKVDLGSLKVTWGKPFDFAIREAETPSMKRERLAIGLPIPEIAWLLT